MNNEIEFNGEYFEGKRWKGKGIEFNENGNIEFDGEYLNGKRWNGALYEYDWEDGQLIFEGQIIDGEKIED